MPIQKDYVHKNVPMPNAYHKIKRKIELPEEGKMLIILGVYKDFVSSSDIINEIAEQECIAKNIDDGDQNYTNYFITAHATKSNPERTENYLTEKDSFYLGATKVP